jgi:charged multivesicular body protein 2B
MNQFIGQLKALTLRISGISTLNEMTVAMENASAAMSKVSSKLDAGKLAQLSKEMAKDDAKLEMKQEMLSDVLDGIGEGMDDPVEQQKLYDAVLKECGVELEGLVN